LLIALFYPHTTKRRKYKKYHNTEDSLRGGENEIWGDK